MKDFIQTKNYEFWNRAADGPKYPNKERWITTYQRKKVNEDVDFMMLGKTIKTNFIFICSLEQHEYN